MVPIILLMLGYRMPVKGGNDGGIMPLKEEWGKYKSFLMSVRIVATVASWVHVSSCGGITATFDELCGQVYCESLIWPMLEKICTT